MQKLRAAAVSPQPIVAKLALKHLDFSGCKKIASPGEHIRLKAVHIYFKIVNQRNNGSVSRMKIQS